MHCFAAESTPQDAINRGDSIKRIPVILDTDIGDDIDDTWALAMLLRRPEVEVKLIVTAREDTVAKARLVAKMLTRLDRTDIPIGIGIKQSDNLVNQAKWLGDFDFKEYSGKVIQDGVQALIDCVMKQDAPITICAIGPQTNLAEAVSREPAIAAHARIVAMAGSVFMGYNGNSSRMAEVNIMLDIPAARKVLAAPWEIIYAPLDVCGDIVLHEAQYTKVMESSLPAAKVVVENYDLWSNRDKFPDKGTSTLYDTSAAYLVFDESCCRIETHNITIDDAGYTIPSAEGHPVRCALGWKDREAFEQMLVDTFAAPGTPAPVETFRTAKPAISIQEKP